MMTTLTVVCTLNSCISPDKRAKKRIDKILRKHPDIITERVKRSSDTIIHIDSFINEMRSFDSTFIFTVDSLYIVEKDGVKTEVKVIQNERIFVKTEVQADTFYSVDTMIIDTLMIEKIISAKDVRPFFDRNRWFFLITAICFSAFVLIFKRS